MKSKIIAAGIMAGLFVLAGCSGRQLEKAELMEPQGTEFNQNLYHGYIGLSESEYAEGDYRDSDAFAMRAASLAKGGDIGPEEIRKRELPGDYATELAEARDRLTTALDAGASEADPGGAADAQIYFDCWMQEQEENRQAKDITRCRDNFYAALDGIEPAPVLSKAKAQSVRFVIYFKTDKYSIDAQGETVISEAMSAAEKLGSPVIKISGNTDTVGSPDYNQKLSEMRAQAVAKVLAAGNTPVRAMITEANGELKPAVITADQVAEPRNRRAEIILEP